MLAQTSPGAARTGHFRRWSVPERVIVLLHARSAALGAFEIIQVAFLEIIVGDNPHRGVKKSGHIALV